MPDSCTAFPEGGLRDTAANPPAYDQVIDYYAGFTSMPALLLWVRDHPSWRSLISSRVLQSMHCVAVGRASRRLMPISTPHTSQ